MIINYQKRWNPETGTCYTQTIKINNNIKEKYNKYLLDIKTDIDKKFFKNHCYSENDLKIKGINYLDNGINFTNLIHLQTFIEFYLKIIYTPPKKDKNFGRILWRNTIIEVVK